MISGVYRIVSIKKPDRCYIGSSKDIYKRWVSHIKTLENNKHHSIKLQRHFIKYGKNDLQFSILMGCDINDLISTEQYFIDVYKPYFNSSLKAKNNGGYKQTEKERIRKREAMLGNKNPNYGRKFSDEHRKKLSDAMQDRRGYNKGRKMSQETKKKISLAHKGKRVSPATEFKKGCVFSDKHRRKISESLKGRIPWNKGKPNPHKGNIPSAETKKKMRIAQIGRTHSKETKEKMSEIRTQYYINKRLLNLQLTKN